MRKLYMKPKPIRKTITIFFSAGRMNFNRTYNKSSGRLNFNFPVVINYEISEICVANIVLQQHFLPDHPCLTDKGATFLEQNTS